MTTAAASIHSRTALPPPTRRGLSRIEAADYVGVGASKFDAMVADGRMLKPKHIDGRRVWDVRALDRAFDLLPGGEEPPDDGGANEWDEVLK